MTTNITELAQSLKAAATNVKETAHIARYLKATIARQTFKELMTPDNILALVEALEKAQQRIEELESDLSEWTDCKHDCATYYDMSGQERCGRCGADV